MTQGAQHEAATRRHPYWAFTEAGYEVEIRSPDGGSLAADSYSDPEDPSGYSAHDILSLGFKKSPRHMVLIQDTKSIDDVNPKAYDAIFVVGGAEQALHLEHMTLLWVRMVRAGGLSPNLVWAALRR